MNGLLIKFYLPNLDDSDLSVAVDCVREYYDHSPRFCGWLMDGLLDEQARRLLSTDVPPETSLLTLPHEKWTTRDLREALTLVTAFTYSVKNVQAGKLFDALVLPIQAAVHARLDRLEKNHARH